MAILCVFGPAEARELSDAEKAEGFVPLVSESDLSGWEVVGGPSWSVTKGILWCDGRGDGWIRTEKTYYNFILRFEYRVGPRGNSGVWLRAADVSPPSYTSMEIQILDDRGRPPDMYGTAALYRAVGPAKNMSKPAREWNEVEIRLVDYSLRVWMNGEWVLDVDLSDDTLDPKGDMPLSERQRKGYIGLQNHGTRVDFRHMRLRRLPGAPHPKGETSCAP